MPWKVNVMSEVRWAFVHEVTSLKTPVARACRKFAISRKTGYKWLGRFEEDPMAPLADRSRRPRSSPARCHPDVEQAILQVRDRLRWGPRKIRAYLMRSQPLLDLPSERTIANVLGRHARVANSPSQAKSTQFFERSGPNDLWQCDFKGPVEIARQKVHPFTVLDDHSRFLLVLRVCNDLTMATAFDVLWNAFGDYGLPEAILCDNSFGTTHKAPKTISWFDSQLLRLAIRPLHGRPDHPQTQGRVERIHGTFERELFPHVR